MTESNENKCGNCGKENPKKEMKFCCRKCTDEFKSKQNNEERSCLICQTKFTVQKSNPKRMCSEKCRKEWCLKPEILQKQSESYKKTMRENFGVENSFQLENVKEKSKETKLEKYGDENYNNPEKVHQTKLEKYGENYFFEQMIYVKEVVKERYGVDHPLHLQEFIDKKTQTNLEKYGYEHVSQVPEFIKKMRSTTFERFGVEHASQNEDVKQKSRETSMKNFGVTHHLKDSEMFKKHMKAQYKTKRYKDTELYYQASYELYFLEKIEEKGFIHEVSGGNAFVYEIDGKEHTYHTDFYFRGKNIEIKSGWTYNENGRNIILQNTNEAKWKYLRQTGELLEVLIDKIAIDNFICNL